MKSNVSTINLAIGYLLAIAFVGLGGFAAVKTIMAYKFFDQNYKTMTEKTTATVSKVKSKTMSNKAICSLEYNFTVKRQKYTQPKEETEGDYSPGNCSKIPGQEINVKYDSSDPAKNAAIAGAADDTQMVAASMAIIPISVLIIIIGFYIMGITVKCSRKRHVDYSTSVEKSLLKSEVEEVDRDED